MRSDQKLTGAELFLSAYLRTSKTVKVERRGD